MTLRSRALRLLAASHAVALAFLVAAVPARAQGRVSGTVVDEYGDAVQGATVVAENPMGAPNTFTVVTDRKGRFGMLGLRGGTWKFTVSAPGFDPVSGSMPIRGITMNTPLNVRLMHTSAAAPLVLAGVDVKALQEKLSAAEGLLDAGKQDQALAAYRDVLAAAPALTAVHLQIGRAERGLRRYDDAVASFGRVPEGDPARERARAEIALTELERGQPDAAEAALGPALAGASPGREVLFAAGELARARRQHAEAAGLYRRAIDADPEWSRVRLALARVEIARGNRDAALAELAKVLADDAGSPEAAEAKTLLDTLQK